MSPASEAQRAQMRVDVGELEAQFIRGMVAQGLSLNVSALVSPLTSLFDLWSGDTKRLVEGMEAERKTLVTWRTRWKTWAEKGQRDDGSAYTVEMWQEVGRTMAASVRHWTGEAVSRNAFVLVKQASKDVETTVVEAKDAVVNVAERLREALPPLPDGKDLERLARYAKWGAAGLMATAFLGAVGYAVRSVR